MWIFSVKLYLLFFLLQERLRIEINGKTNKLSTIRFTGGFPNLETFIEDFLYEITERKYGCLISTWHDTINVEEFKFVEEVLRKLNIDYFIEKTKPEDVRIVIKTL